jgi:large subunit ribosomal protein L30
MRTEHTLPFRMRIKTMAENVGKIKIQYFRSKIATPVKHKLVVKGLGFTRLNQIVEREDTPSIRGMIAVIPHLVRVVE